MYSKYGCCRDNETAAKGYRFAGCKGLYVVDMSTSIIISSINAVIYKLLRPTSLKKTGASPLGRHSHSLYQDINCSMFGYYTKFLGLEADYRKQFYRPNSYIKSQTLASLNSSNESVGNVLYQPIKSALYSICILPNDQYIQCTLYSSAPFLQINPIFII